MSKPEQQSWEVEVRVNGDHILTIGTTYLAGVSNIEDYADIVRQAGNHLLSFIGPEERQPFIIDDAFDDALMSPLDEERQP